MKTLRNERNKQEILERLRTIQPTSQRQWGKMSAHQMVCHLGDTFGSAMGLRNESSPVHWFPPPVLLRFVALWVPFPWPKGFKTVPEWDQHVRGTRPIKFEVDMEGLQDLIDRFTREPPDFEFQVHPHFGSMSNREWMHLGYLHASHHLRQFGA